MIHQDGEPTADQHHERDEIEEVGVAEPPGKTMHSGECSGISCRMVLRQRGKIRQAEHCPLNPSRHERNQHQADGDYDKRWFNPYPEPPVRWVVNGSMSSILYTS